MKSRYRRSSVLVVTTLMLILWSMQMAGATEAELPEADALSGLVEAMWAGSDRATIEVKLREVLALREKNLPPSHSAIVATIGRLGDNEYNRRQFASAEQHYVLWGPRDPTRWSLPRCWASSLLRSERADYAAAEAVAWCSLDIRRGLVAPSDLWIAAGLDNLVQTVPRQGRFEQALPLAKEALSTRLAGLGAGNVLVQQSEVDLSQLRNVRLAGQLAWALPLGLILLLVAIVIQARPSSGIRLKYSVVALFAGSAVLGYCGYTGARTLVPVYFPSLETDIGGYLHSAYLMAAFLIAWATFYLPSIVLRLSWPPHDRDSALHTLLRIAQIWKHRPLEEMVAVLGQYGIGLRPVPADTPPHATMPWPPPADEKRRIEKGGFEALLIAMSDHSNDVWHFDTEAIYDHGDYKDIVDNLCRLSNGVLVFDEVRDFVDIAKGIARVELIRGGKTERIDLIVNDDWVDEAIFAALQSRLIATGTERRFAVKGLIQDVLVACLTPQQMHDLRRATAGDIWFEAQRAEDAS